MSIRLDWIVFQSLFCSSPRVHENHLSPVQHLPQSQRLRKDDREVDVDEENWFNDDGDDNKLSSNNHGTLFNNGSDDEDSQPESTTTTTAATTTADSSAMTIKEPIRSHSRLSDNDDETLPINSSETTLRSHHHQKPMISIHIRRSPISSVGQLSPTSSTTASMDNDSTILRVDIPPTTSNGSGSSRPVTPTESTSTFAMVRKENEIRRISWNFVDLEPRFIEYCRSV